MEGLGSHREKRTMVPNEVKDFVLSQRKGLGKFQGKHLTETFAFLVKAKHYLHTGNVQVYMN